MESTPWVIKRALAGAGVFALAGALITGCSGGGSGASTQALPHTPPATGRSAVKMLKPVTVSRANTAAVMSKLVRATAYYSPRRGARLRLLKTNRSPMSVSQGMDLSYYGGPVQTGANEYNILVNCNDESCWGGMISQ